MAANLQTPATNNIALSVREVSDWKELEQLRPEWTSLLLSNPSLGVFSTLEWLGPWWNAYGAEKQLITLVLTDFSGRVIAILPMYVEQLRQGLPVKIRRARMVGDGSTDSDDLDFLVYPGYEDAVVTSFLSWARSSRVDVFELNCISPRSSLISSLRERIFQSGWTHEIDERPAVKISLPGTWEQYLKQLSSKERGKVGTRYRHLQNRFNVRFYRCETLQELPRTLETLFGLHQKRWNAKGEPGSFSLNTRRHFYYEMAGALLAKGRLELWVLELNGEPAAAQIGLRYGSKVYSLQEGFDPAFASASVGYVLRSHVLRYCIETGIRDYDFLAGAQESKQRWGTSSDKYIDLHFARPGSLGGIDVALARRIRIVKDWLKRHLPEDAVEKLQAFRRRGSQ